jgi:hypothetical protein
MRYLAPMMETPATIVDWACERLARLCAGVDSGIGSDGERVQAALREALACFGDRRAGDTPVASSLFINGCPFDLSVSFGARANEVRFEVETQTLPPSVEGFNQATRALLARVSRAGAHDPARFLRLWAALGHEWLAHPGARVTAGETTWKCYLTTHYRFRERFTRWEAALDALALPAAAARLRDFVRASGWVFTGFGCSLIPGDEEVEVYLMPPWKAAVSPADIEAVAAIAIGHHAGDFAAFVTDLLGPTPRRIGPPGALNVSFVADRSGLHTPTCFVPMPIDLDRSGTPSSDALVAERVRAVLHRLGTGTAAYDRALSALAVAPLETTHLLHYFVSLRRKQGEPRLAVYFTPSVDPRGFLAPGTPALPVTAAR